MVRLYMDENVRGAVTRGLRQRGVDVLTVQEDGRAGTPDPQVLERALELGRVLFTQDDDLLVEAARRQAEGEPFLGIVYAHQEKVTIGACIDGLELIAVLGEVEEFANRVEYLPL